MLGFLFFSSYTLGIKSFISEDAGHALGKYWSYWIVLM